MTLAFLILGCALLFLSGFLQRPQDGSFLLLLPALIFFHGGPSVQISSCQGICVYSVCYLELKLLCLLWPLGKCHVKRKEMKGRRGGERKRGEGSGGERKGGEWRGEEGRGKT